MNKSGNTILIRVVRRLQPQHMLDDRQTLGTDRRRFILMRGEPGQYLLQKNHDADICKRRAHVLIAGRGVSESALRLAQVREARIDDARARLE